MLTDASLVVIGGGLAGSEAAWQAAERGIRVTLVEMRPARTTPAHVTDRLAELICSNSLGSDKPATAPGLLKAELRRLGSLIMVCADATAIPAGGALGVDRERFAARVTERIENHPRIQVRREEATRAPDGPAIVASGPLTSDALAGDIARLAGREHLYFYDAIAPIVAADSIDRSIAFRASRYGTDSGAMDGGDYLNCPMTRDEYDAFVDALVSAERIELRDFEREDARFFEGCLPIEVMAARGRDTLAFGPMRPIGLRDPRSGRRPHAVVQLRQDNLAGTLYNIVGFQTNLKWPEQKRVLRMIPGLAQAEFMRYGMMHRNTFINAPMLLEATMQFRARPDLFFAGQIVGVEGYVGNAATGWVAGVNAARRLLGEPLLTLPRETMIGALCHYVAHADAKDFQHMKANFGLVPELERPIRHKQARHEAYAARALEALEGMEAISRSHDSLSTQSIQHNTEG
ncbi:MAG TPA: methylenetetrahydrofolate--tRNA-(uracil(54)-C(5))-methyltransferase (FADH(2)-oxidizing) TrmFO [Anaerolineae bacterium]|nr:methylenetetrahydrofolate--tRNA-(uracil(54)-C(5))-methyltransferase (FADH(2)-oxidizing) TrmFO [Anaerolineae bacterium]